MNLAPLQLVDYFVHSIRVEALADYDVGRSREVEIGALEVSEQCHATEGDPHRFAVELLVRQEAVAGRNIPYAFELQMVGFVEVHPDFPADRLLRTVETNGPSMLFGAAREILRAATGRGPYGPVLLPSTTFLKPTGAGKPPAPAARKRAPRKKKP